MKVTDKCIEVIKGFEGCVLHTYKDQAGIPTIGYGTVLFPDGTKPVMGQVISKEKAEDLLRWEVSLKAHAVDKYVTAKLSQSQYDSLVSLVYNIGEGGFRSSTLLKRINACPADDSIRSAFLMWDKIHKDGQVVADAGLKSRRSKEADLYFS